MFLINEQIVPLQLWNILQIYDRLIESDNVYSSFINGYHELVSSTNVQRLVSRWFLDGMQIANCFARFHCLNDAFPGEILHSACVRDHSDYLFIDNTFFEDTDDRKRNELAMNRAKGLHVFRVVKNE